MSSATYYTQAEDDLLRSVYATATRAELERIFPGRTFRGLTVRASRLGVRKNKDAYEAGLPLESSLIGHLSETEKAYLAGIIDGEGCIMLQRRTHLGPNKPIYALYVSVANTSVALMEWLEQRLPGNSYVKRKTAGPSHWRTRYEWTLAGNRRVMVFLREIAPYLVIKKPQAEMLMNGYVHLPENERFALFTRMRELKQEA